MALPPATPSARKQTPSVTRSLICDRGLDAGAVLADADLVAALQGQALGVRRRDLQALLGREELQRRIQLGDRAGPEVAVGAEGEGAGASRHWTRRTRFGGGASPRGRRSALSVRRPRLSAAGRFAAAGGVLPADAAAADLGVGDAGVEGDRVGQGGEGGGLGVDAGVVAEGRGELGEDLPVGADVAGAAGAGADALQAAVGVGDGAVFLGVGLEREEDVGLGGGGVLEGSRRRRRSRRR